MARLRDGVTFEAAQSELQSLIGTVPQAYPGDRRAQGNVDAKLVFAGQMLKEATLGNVSRGLWRANTATRQRHYTRQVLLGAQVALALILLIASGLMVRSFQSLRAIDPGFDSRSALTFGVGLADREYVGCRRAALGN